jgi:hypothetical protein
VHPPDDTSLVEIVTKLAVTIQRWTARREAWEALDGWISAQQVCETVLADLHAIQSALDEMLLPLTQAAQVRGCSREHLSRRLKAGALRNYGRPHAPRLRLGDLVRSGPLPNVDGIDTVAASSKRHIVRSVADLRRRSNETN